MLVLSRPLGSLLVVVAFLAASTGVSGHLSATGRSAQLGASPAEETRGLWVVRDSLTSPASIASVVDRAASGGFNTLFVQVRGRGDAYYLNGAEPRAHTLAGQPAAFDPLATTIELAHRAGLQVHAWINLNLVASVALPPASRDHVVNRHPEWLMVPRVLAQDLARETPSVPGYLGRLTRWTRAQAEAVEGLFLSPIVPGAAAHTVSVVEDIVRRYAVDGVHLDYVRYPGPEFDYSRLALAEFASTMAPTLAPVERVRMAARASEDILAWVDAYPEAWADFRRSRLTALVMKVRTAVKSARPGLFLSAAVFPDAQSAYTSRLQDWRRWAENGLLDAVCPMAYTTDLVVFQRQIAEAVRTTAPAVVFAGIGAYRLTAPQTVAHIGGARAAGARGIVLFSYDSVTARATDGADAYLETVRRAAFASATASQHDER